MVTYIYTVTNPGIVALSAVSVIDDKCGPLIGYFGDTNSDALLDVSETWFYTCQKHLTMTTMNTVTAVGSANGFTAVDLAIATVLVATPGFPNTGIDPEDKSTLIHTVLLSSVLLLFSVPILVVLRKRFSM